MWPGQAPPRCAATSPQRRQCCIHNSRTMARHHAPSPRACPSAHSSITDDPLQWTVSPMSMLLPRTYFPAMPELKTLGRRWRPRMYPSHRLSGIRRPLQAQKTIQINKGLARASQSQPQAPTGRIRNNNNNNRCARSKWRWSMPGISKVGFYGIYLYMDELP